MANQIRELRIAKGMTVQELADKAGLSQGYVTKLEGRKRGTKGLTDNAAQRLAEALEAPVAVVMGVAGGNAASETASFSEDAEPYDYQDDDILRDFVKKRENVLPYRIKTNTIDRLDIRAGDVAFLDISAEAVENIEPLAPVVARIYGEAVPSTTPVTIVRQFVPPTLLIANTTGKPLPNLDLDRDPVAIKGVIIGKYSSLKKP